MGFLLARPAHLHEPIGEIELSPIIDLPSVYWDPAQSWVARMSALSSGIVGPSRAPRRRMDAGLGLPEVWPKSF